MSITLVGTATGTNTCTVPAHNVGDLIVIFAFRNTTGTPAIPATYTSANTKVGTTCSARIGSRIATATNDASGTWTNATALVCHVYRTSGYSTGSTLAIGGSATSSSTTSTVNYPALTMTNSGGTSWAAGFAGVSNTSETIATAPSGMTNESHETASATQAAGHDTEGAVSSWSSTNVTTTGTTTNSVSMTVEICENVPASTSFPNIIQRTSTAYDNVGLDNSVGNDFTVIVPNSSLASNGLLLAVQYPSGTAPTAITDDQSNTWSATALVTADAGAGNNALSVYYLTTANTSTQVLTISFGSSTAVNPVKAWVYETYNVTGHNNTVQANTVNTAGVVSPGSFTPTNNNANGGNIIFAFMAPTSNSVTLASGITAANNYFLMDADISMPGNGMQFASQVYVQATSAATAPLFNLQNGGSSTYNVCAIALPIGVQGTPKPAGIHVDGTAFFGSSGPGTKWKLQLPHTGNLVCLATVADGGSTSTTDSAGNNMSVQGSGLTGTFYYQANLSANPGYFGTVNYSAGPANVMMVYYDISGAAASPFDVYASSGNQTATTNSVTNAPSITPTTSNGLVIATEQLGTGPSWGPGVSGGVTSPSGAINAYAWYYAAQFTAGISTTTLTVASTAWGANPLYNGTVQITGSGVTNGTAVTAGTGPTYTVAPSQTVTAGTVMNQLDPDGNTLNWGNGCAHYYNPNTNTINWTWNVPWQQGGAAGAIAFKAAAVSSPFVVPDMMFPVGPMPRLNRGHYASTMVQLIGQDVIPGGDAPGKAPAYDYPPWLAPRPAVTLRTHLDPSRIHTIGLDQIYGAPGQAPRYDLPNPTPAKADNNVNRTWLYQLVNNTLGLILFPFAQTEWPNPIRALFRMQDHSSRTSMAGQDQLYGTAGEVPVYDHNANPVRRKDDYNNRGWIYEILRNTLTTIVIPFAMFDWPNPRGPKSDANVNRTHLDQTKQQLIGKDAFYGASGQVPTYEHSIANPVLRKPDFSLRTWLLDIIQILTAIFPQPTFSADFPNPLKYVAQFRNWSFTATQSLHRAQPRPLPIVSTTPNIPPVPHNIQQASWPTWITQIARNSNLQLAGKMNATTQIVLQPGATSTTLTDSRIGQLSHIQLMPLSASAASILASGQVWFQVTSGSVTINHPVSGNFDMLCSVLIIG